MISSQHPQSALGENRATSLTLRKNAKNVEQVTMEYQLARNASSNGTSHSQLTQLREIPKRSRKYLERLPRTLLYLEIDSFNRHYQRTIICVCHAMKHVLHVSCDIQLQICINTQTSYLSGLKTIQHIVLDLNHYLVGSRTHKPVSYTHLTLPTILLV